MKNLLRVAQIGGFALVAVGCKPKSKCDADKLAKAEAMLEGEASREQLHEAAVLLGQACPVGEGVVNGLLDEYGTGARVDYIYSGDEEYGALMREFCADPEAATEASQRRADAEVYAACELSRFDLLEADAYRARHKAAFVALFALEKAGVESARARSIASAFIEASAPPPGVELFPESSSDVAMDMVDAFSREESIVIRADALVSGETTVSLVDGLVAEPGGHVIGPLEKQLQRRADAVPELFADEPGSLFIGAHADAPLRTVVDALYTGSSTNHGQATLAVQNRGEPMRLPVGLPARWKMWSKEGETRRDNPQARIVARLAGGELIVSHRAGTPLGRAKLSDAAAIEGLAREAASQVRDDPKVAGTVEIDVAPEVSVQTLVSTIDALRGKDCSLREIKMRGQGGDACHLWQVRLDLWPPIPRREGPWEDLEFKLSSSTDRFPAKGSKKPNQLEAMVEEVMPKIQACLEESAEALAWKPERITFMFADDEKGVPAVRVTDDDGVPVECVEQTLGLDTVGIERLHLVYAEVVAEVHPPQPEP